MILMLKRTPGIYLVGFMGSGKTTIGRVLAEKLGWNFADLDEDIVAAERRSISSIFENEGEEHFRKLETEALERRIRRVQHGEPVVLALGGGAFAQPGNFELLENNGFSIWLDCSLERVKERVDRQSHRPLARDPLKFEELYNKRREAYARADFRIKIASDDPEAALAEILRLPIFQL